MLNVSTDARGVVTISGGGSPAGDIHRELSSLWRRLEDDPAVSLVVFDAEIPVQAGLLETLRTDNEARARVWREAFMQVRDLVELTKPLLAVVRGRCTGMALVATMFADITLASESAVFVDSHTRLRVAAGDHAVITWPLAVGMPTAKRVALLGEEIPADEAKRLGLVRDVVPADGVDICRDQHVARILEVDLPAFRATKHSLHHWYRERLSVLDASLAHEIRMFAD